MDLTAITDNLATIADSPSTTSPSAATRLSKETAELLEPLREYLTELDILLAEAEAAGELLGDVGSDERADQHEALVAACAELRDHLIVLLPDRVLAPAGSSVAG